METWKEITWTNGRYYVSDLGNVMSVGGKKKGKTIMKPRIQNSGYNIVKLFVDGHHITCLVHRLVALAFIGECQGMDVNHKNGNKTDNRVSNLEWCTRKENMEHCIHNHLRSDIKKVAALKGGKIICVADFSRELAVKMADFFPNGTNVETIARSMRKKIDTGKSYYGYTFISIKNL